MMFSYENGIVIAFLLWLFNAVALLISINSRFERNLNRIGQRISWLTLTPKMMDEGDLTKSLGAKIGKYLLIVGIGLPFVFASWLYVLLAIAQFLYGRAKDSGAPQVVREFRWKLRNMDMTFDQLVKELMKVSSVEPENYDEFRANLIFDLDRLGIPRS